MELVATCLDNASGPLRQVRAALDQVRTAGVELDAGQSKAFASMKRQTDSLINSSEGFRNVSRRTQELGTQFKQVGGHAASTAAVITSSLSPAIVRLVSMTVGAVVSIAAFRRSMEESRTIQEFARSTGFAASQVKLLGEAGEEFNVPAERMRQVLAGLGTQLRDLRYVTGGDLWAKILPAQGAVPELARAVGEARQLMVAAGNDATKLAAAQRESFDVIIRGVAELTQRVGEAEAKDILSKLGLAPELVNMSRRGLSGLTAELARIGTQIRMLDPKKVEDFDRAWRGFRRTLDGFTANVIEPLLPGMTRLMTATTELWTAPSGDYWLTDKLREAGEALRPIWADIRSSFESEIEKIKEYLTETVWPKIRIEVDLAVGDIKRFESEEWPTIVENIKTAHTEMLNFFEARPVNWEKVFGIGQLTDRFTAMILHLERKIEEFRAWIGSGKPGALEAAGQREMEFVEGAFGFGEARARYGAEFSERARVGRAQRRRPAGEAFPQAAPSGQTWGDWFKSRLPWNPEAIERERQSGAFNPPPPPVAVPQKFSEAMDFSSYSKRMAEAAASGFPLDVNMRGPRSSISELSGGYSENIEDRRAEEKNTAALEDVADQLRRLNDFFLSGEGAQFFTGGGAGVGPGGPGVGGGPGAGIGPQGSTAPMGRLPGWGGTGTKPAPLPPPAAPRIEDQFTPGFKPFGPPPGKFTPGFQPQFRPGSMLPGGGAVGAEGVGGVEAGAGGPDIEAAARMQRYIAGIGYLESSLRPDVAEKSEKGNTGFFKFNAADAARAAKAGLPDPRSGTLAQQADATRQYIETFFPQAAAHIKAGNFTAANSLLNKFWVSLPGGKQRQSANRYSEHARILAGQATYGPAATLAEGGGETRQQRMNIAMASVTAGEGRLPAGMLTPERMGLPSDGGQIRLGERGAHGYQSGNVQVEPWLVDTVRNATKALPEGYRAEVISSVDPRARTPWHPSGRAIDVTIYDAEGRAIPNVGDRRLPGYEHYERMALAARQYAEEKYPEQKFVWGGHFDTGVPYDRMHFQSGGISARNFTQEQLAQRVMPEVPTRMLAARPVPAEPGVGGEGAPGIDLAGLLGTRSIREEGGALGATREPGTLGAKSSEVKHSVEGSGKITVDVNAPRGTKVKAESAGMFNKIEMNRNLSAQPANQRPSIEDTGEE